MTAPTRSPAARATCTTSSCRAWPTARSSAPAIRTRASCASTSRRAAALPGVLAVVTGADVEQHPFGFAKDQLALKTGKVRCVRDEIAAVAAESAAIAEEALDLIEVEYAELPAVFDPLAAVRPGAPLVHEERPHQPHRSALPVQPRRRGACVRDGRRGGRGRVSAELRHAGLSGHDGRHRRLGRRGPADHVVHHPGAVSLPARSRPGARHHRRSRPGAAAAGRRQLRPRARSLSDRRDRRAAGPPRAAAGEDRVRAAGGVRGVPHARAVHDPPAYRRRRAGPAAGPRLPRGHRQRRLCLLGLHHAVRDALDGGRPLSVPGGAVRHDDRLHQQSLFRLDAGLRQPRIDVRGRERRWTSSPTGSASTASSCAGAT